MTANCMTCAEAEPLLPLVADGAIDPDSDPTLFAHLAACPDCQRIVAGHDLIALAIARVPAPRPRRRNAVLRLWPWAAAAAAVLILALGLGATSASTSSTDPPVAAQPPPAPAATVATAPAPAPASLPEVIAIPRSDGSMVYLVRRGDAWVPIDPRGLDGPVQPGAGVGSGVQVRY